MKYYAVLILLLSLQAQGEIHKCIDPTGSVSYQAYPCQTEENSVAYEPKAIETKYKTIPNVKIKQSKSVKKNQKQNSCPFIPSYELRNLRVKDQYKIGIKKQDIRKRLGQPTSMKKNKWTYLGNHVNRTFNFKNGCLTQWKEKWKGKESQISKYRN